MSIIKNALLIGAGYVIGAHAGRERYEQLKQQATKLLQRPEVKQAGNRAKDAVAQKLPGGGGDQGDAGTSAGDATSSTSTATSPGGSPSTGSTTTS